MWKRRWPSGPRILDSESLMREAGVRPPDPVGHTPAVVATGGPGWRERLRASLSSPFTTAPTPHPPAVPPRGPAQRPASTPAPPRVAPLRPAAHPQRPPAPASSMASARAPAPPMSPHGFADLLGANQSYATSFPHGGFDGLARAGVAVVTCMDSRIDPLGMLGLRPGDAKIIRNPGGRVSPDAVEGLVLAVNLLGVRRILVVVHTECAMGVNTDRQLRQHVTQATGIDASWQSFHTFKDPAARLRDDVHALKAHPLIPAEVGIGGFVYDVATGRLRQEV